ncbi:sigma-70 family RNA polymerase sigma factor [Paenibacillus contaminans]|uniref:RNA polymerase subunit sigma-70 n=1 Tax=Paenibacillus contaminans TaxID=450362 RepID=A0A329LM45_9BACL|nr:sigma-70 family RNA polymerase sigma factor [Paenibacillus contaminans]RAV08809.1 RNA polymerase subunit sigma-70 [Paenibacillus contaminans]
MNHNESSKPLYEMYNRMKLYKETDCPEAATALLVYYEPVVRSAAGKMSRNRPDLLEDLYQVGRMSMLKLFKQYDSSMNIPFEGYAMKSLIGHLKNYLRDKSWYIQVPRKIKEKSSLVQRTIDELTIDLERSPNVDEIAAHLDISPEETIEILAGRDYYHYTSLDTPLSNEGESAATIADMIAAPVDDYRQVEIRMALQDAMDCLKEEEKRVLSLIYDEGQPQRLVAEQLGVTQMSVSRIQRRAIHKLKQVLSEPPSGEQSS